MDSLTPSRLKFAQVLGVTAQYKISEVADRNSGVTLKIKKSLLASLAEAK